MIFFIGDIVSRNSYKNDLLFKITNIDGDRIILEGIDERLIADCNSSDLRKEIEILNDDKEIIENLQKKINLNMKDYFYLPGKVLHIDGDKEYLNRCMNLYNKMNIMSYGVVIKENELENEITKYLEKVKPNILVITGHDAKTEDNKYKNSKNFINAIKKARDYERSIEKLIIVAGACQSDYEELIKSGANFASSPKRINIHALDPAIIASRIALSDKNEPINLIEIIDDTKYKEKGFGGIITNGVMYQGYPR